LKEKEVSFSTSERDYFSRLTSDQNILIGIKRMKIRKKSFSPLIRTAFPTISIGINVTLRRAKDENVTETKIGMEQKDVSEL